MYAVRQGLEAVGMATPGQGGSAAGGSVPVAAVGADGGSGAAAATVATPSGCVVVFAERLSVVATVDCEVVRLRMSCGCLPAPV